MGITVQIFRFIVDIIENIDVCLNVKICCSVSEVKVGFQLIIIVPAGILIILRRVKTSEFQTPVKIKFSTSIFKTLKISERIL
jgi:hypothetical protein